MLSRSVKSLDTYHKKKIETISIPFSSLHPQAPDVLTLPRDLIYHHSLALNTGSK